MAHTVYLGSFTKKLNSTAQPNYSGWGAYSCSFKEETSLYSPTLRLTADWASLASANYNYAVMQSRYYWIRDIRAIRSNYVEVDLQLDPLATYKSRITATSAFIEYGFNDHDAGAAAYRMPDQRITINNNPAFYSATVDMTGDLLSRSDGVYIVQAVGYNSNGPHKGLATFALTETQLRQMMASIQPQIDNLLTGIMNNTTLTDQQRMNELTNLSLKTELTSESAIAAIQSVKWMPFKLSKAVGTLTTLYLGNHSTGISSALMLATNTNYWYGADLDIPWPVADWKRNNCQMLLYLPFFGTIPVQVDQNINAEFIGISFSAEFFSGSISVIVNVDNKYTIYTGSTNVSVDMGVGRSMVGASAMIGGGLQALGGAMQMAGGVIDAGAGAISSALGIGGGVSGAMQNISGGAANMFQGYAQMIQPQITAAGSMGGMASIAQNKLATLELLYYAPINESAFRAKYGHPVFSVETPAGGFCKTRGFSVSGPMPGNYAAAINSAMDGGVYIE